MSENQPLITIQNLFHRDKKVIGISFDYDTKIINQIKTLKGRKYSATHKCWYIPYTTEAYTNFRKLNLSYTVHKEDTSKHIISRGHAQESLPDKHQSANEEKTPRLSDIVGHREQEPTSDIFRTQVGKIDIRFSQKYFYLSMPYEEAIITNIKKLKRVWWNRVNKKWICQGSHTNLELMQNMFVCWSDQQMEQLRIMIGAYENPKKIILYRLPDQDSKIAVKLCGYGIDHQAIQSISGREYQKSHKRWLIPNDTDLIKRIITHYTTQHVEVVNRLPADNAIDIAKERSNHDKQAYFLSKYCKQDRALVRQISDTLIQQRYSWQTIRSYSGVLVKYSAWLRSGTVAHCSLDDVQNYLTYLSKQKVSDSLLNTHVSALKFYFGKVINRPEMSVTRIKRPRKSFRLPRILSRQEVTRMIEVTDNLKHRTILYAIYSGGLRLVLCQVLNDGLSLRII